MPESSDEPIRRETFRKPGRQECADWDAHLNQAILVTDIREGWEGFVELFDRFYDEEVMVVIGYDGAGVQVKVPIASDYFRFSSRFTW